MQCRIPMFDRLIVSNRRTVLVVTLVVWFAGMVVALPGLAITLALIDMVVEVPEKPFVMAALVVVHGAALLVGPLSIASMVPRWTLRMMKSRLHEPTGADAPLVGALEAVALAAGRTAPKLVMFEADRPNACALFVDTEWIVIATTGVRDLPRGEREALMAIALGRTITLSGNLVDLESWSMSGAVVSSVLPQWTLATLVVLPVAATTALLAVGRITGSDLAFVPVFLWAPALLLVCSYLVMKAGFDRSILRSAVLGGDAVAVSYVRNPSDVRSLFARVANKGSFTSSRAIRVDAADLPIWVLPHRAVLDSAFTKRRVEQLDLIDPSGAATGFNASDVQERQRGPFHKAEHARPN